MNTEIMLNLNTILCIIKHIYIAFSTLFVVQFLAPQLFWHGIPFFRCFPVTIIPLFQNTGSCSFILLTMVFPSFTTVFSLTCHDLCFYSGLFILFCFFCSSSFPHLLTQTPICHFFSSVQCSLYLSHHYFLFTSYTSPTSLLAFFSLLLAYTFQVLKGSIEF